MLALSCVTERRWPVLAVSGILALFGLGITRVGDYLTDDE